MLVNKDFHQPTVQCVFSLNMTQKPTQTARNRTLLVLFQSCRTSNYVRSVAMSWFQSDICVMERLRKNSTQTICMSWGELCSVESNETTAATVSCDLAPPPQRRRRRHPPPPPPRNLPFVTLPARKYRAVCCCGSERFEIFLRSYLDACEV